MGSGQESKDIADNGYAAITRIIWFAVIGSDYSDRIERRAVDQVVIEHGTLPLDDLYFDLKPLSRNLGAVDIDALKTGREQALAGNPAGAFQLFRIGDAVASRNIHAAIYDALRLCMAV